jgi:peptidoglycan-N-acetylglucosamine deacetylase
VALVLAGVFLASAEAAPAAARGGPRYRAIGCTARGPAQARFGGPHRKLVAIGFDDGPWSDTPAFVRMLERARAPATFFMVGRQVTSATRALLRRELHDGDALGNHSFTHADLTRTGDLDGQLRATSNAIHRQTGYTPCVFRPPYGAFDDSVVRAARSLGMATVLWNVDPTDWGLPGTAAIEQRVLSQVRPGSIIISHDGGGPRGETLAAYPGIIAGLRRRGYRLVTIPQLLGFRTIYTPCRRHCDGRAVHRPLPPGSIVERTVMTLTHRG